ncbi:MAG: hypothetical protein ACKOWR_00810 [Micrococcales bacterium]
MDEDTAKIQLRMVLDRGMAAVLIDFLWAAKAMKLEDWAIEEAKREFDNSTAKTVQLYLADAQKNAKRGTLDMSNITEMLVGVGYESTLVHGMLATLSQVMHGKRIPFAEKQD